jgi:hypothetical protein
MKAGTAVTVSGITTAAAASGDRLFVGQQYGTIRFSGDAQERISFTVSKIATLNTEPITAGVNYDQRSANEERSYFTVGKNLLVDRVTPGLGTAIRVSGSDVERTPFNITMLMKAGTASTVSGVTVAAAASGDRLFVGQQYGGSRFSGDTQERISFAATKLTSDTTIAGVGYDQRAANEERSYFTVNKTATVGTDPVTVGFGSSLNTGFRVSGSDLERLSINATLLAKQGVNSTVSGVTIAAAARGDSLRIGQQYGGNRFSGDNQELIKFDIIKSLEAGSNSSLATLADLFKVASVYARGPAFTQDVQNSSDANAFSVIKSRTDAVTPNDQPALTSTKLLTDLSGDLDRFGNINTLDSHGILRMTNYADLAYFAEDYVGESRSFT